MQIRQNYSILPGEGQPPTREELTCLIPGEADFSPVAEAANGRDAVQLREDPFASALNDLNTAPLDGADPGAQMNVLTRVFRRFAEDFKDRNERIERTSLLTRWQSRALREIEAFHHTMAGLLSMLLNIALLLAACLTLAVQPALLQTWWFRALLLTCAGLATLAIYQLRVHQLTRLLNVRFEERLAERTRIARELHDTLLQGFQGITLRMQGVTKNLPIQDPLRKMMDEVLDRADEVMREARHRVRNLRQRTSHENELPNRLAKCGEELSQDYAASFTLAVVGEPRVLEPAVQDEAYKIAGEALTNAFRHASALKIEIEITYNSSALRMRVRDDGVGIDKAVLSNGQPDHWGLTGMRERARTIRAELRIWSREAAGTEVELVIPASIAYPREEIRASDSQT